MKFRNFAVIGFMLFFGASSVAFGEAPAKCLDELEDVSFSRTFNLMRTNSVLWLPSQKKKAGVFLVLSTPGKEKKHPLGILAYGTNGAVSLYPIPDKLRKNNTIKTGTFFLGNMELEPTHGGPIRSPLSISVEIFRYSKVDVVRAGEVWQETPILYKAAQNPKEQKRLGLAPLVRVKGQKLTPEQQKQYQTALLLERKIKILSYDLADFFEILTKQRAERLKHLEKMIGDSRYHYEYEDVQGNVRSNLARIKNEKKDLLALESKGTVKQFMEAFHACGTPAPLLKLTSHKEQVKALKGRLWAKGLIRRKK